jgi:hypothetical protein
MAADHLAGVLAVPAARYCCARALSGLWDTVKVPGLVAGVDIRPRRTRSHGRHAIAVDGARGPFARPAAAKVESIEEVWFRGARCDITGGSGACWPVANITLDWMLDGAVNAGAIVRAGSRYDAPSPSELDALGETARTILLRTVPPTRISPGAQRNGMPAPLTTVVYARWPIPATRN